ncbi:MAG TPA: ribonuclease HI [Tepidisphaeraceae bacterium]|jgi:ribonuclease HI|nr:ribonuclease HI [Tepidisphaeraceae bacterium]
MASTPTAKLPDVDLFTDGSCRNSKIGGWAFILRHKATGVEKVQSGRIAKTNSERAEIEAVIKGLSALKKRSHVTVHCDCLSVITGIRDCLPEWKRFGWRKSPTAKKPIVNIDLWQLLDPLLEKHEVTTKWVKGHAGHPENARCDKLSTEAISGMSRNETTPAPTTPVKTAATPTTCVKTSAAIPGAAAGTPLPEIDLFTDGACIGNPGPGGWAFILRHRKSGVEKQNSGGLRDTTNNRMEILAAVEGLAALKRPSRVTLHSDSTYVINGLRDWMTKWKRHGFRRSIGSKVTIKNADLWQRAAPLLAIHEMSYVWVRGHAGHPENERCDVLSVQAADKAARDPNAPADVRPVADNPLFDD